MTKIKPQKWSEVYPQGTAEGDEEFGFWIALTRNQQKWRSVSSIATEAKISNKRCEEIISKYYYMGMVLQNPNNDDLWGYWEEHEHLLPEIPLSLVARDHEERIARLRFHIQEPD